jgi:hypothetical protein
MRLSLLLILVAGNAYAQPSARILFTASEPEVPKVATMIGGKMRWMPLDLTGPGTTGNYVEVVGFGLTNPGGDGVTLWNLVREDEALVVDFIHGELTRIPWSEAELWLRQLARDAPAKSLRHMRAADLRRCILAFDERRSLARCAAEVGQPDARYVWEWCGATMCVHILPTGEVVRTGSAVPSGEDLRAATHALNARRVLLQVTGAIRTEPVAPSDAE